MSILIRSKPGPRPLKVWTLKNMHPEKHGINMGLKNMSAFREFSKENVECDLQIKSLCTNFDI